MIRRAAARALLALCLGVGFGAAAGAETAPAPVPEPDGYRLREYRAPVPATLEGATVLDTEAARALWREGEAVFVDVLPSPPRPANLPADVIWQAPSRDTVPDAVWLPDVGYGEIAPETDRYFRRHLERLTGGDRDRPVVFFCLPDCWMSWNAARRAVVEYGMRQVYWYPSGTEGWVAAGLPVEKVRAAE